MRADATPNASPGGSASALRAGEGEIELPGVGLDRAAAHRGNGVHEEQHVVELPAHGGERFHVLQHTGGRLGVHHGDRVDR
jgi:hypothetical protein